MLTHWFQITVDDRRIILMKIYKTTHDIDALDFRLNKIRMALEKILYALAARDPRSDWLECTSQYAH